ncbi:MAG: hypothetical protein H6737_00675 [Alphaproteobacteria bacterium]|nr:hypothetical protein [Alphaproteobacteria bacterium]
MRRVFVLLAWVGCKSGEPEVAYHTDVRPLIERNCLACHTDGAIAPFPLTSYDEVRVVQELVVNAVESRSMPPWGQDPSCREAVGSLWLEDDEVATFTAWRDQGFPEGDPEAYRAPAPREEPPDAGPPDLDLASVPYTPDDSRADDYRCLVLGEPTPDDLFVTGAAVRPDQVAMAHHALIYAVPRDGRDRLLQLDADDAGPGYRCFGDPGLSDAQTIGGWVPGRETRLLPEGMAMRIPAGSTLVLQMHYNTAAVSEVAPDASRMQLWTLPEGQLPTQLLTIFPVAKTDLAIPAGDPASVQSKLQRIPVDAHIAGTAPHMHLLGRRLTTKLVRPDGDEECLSDVRYDFDWQRAYAFPEPYWVPITADDRLEITCEYDNSGGSGTVTWGDGTADEMCLDYLSLVSPYVGAGTGQVCDGAAACVDSCAADDVSCALTCMMGAGDGCLLCGAEVGFSDCTIQACVLDAIPLGTCMDGCAYADEDTFECLLGSCRSQAEQYWACRTAAVDDGTCPSDGESCPGL